jgi:hypothetical protein
MSAIKQYQVVIARLLGKVQEDEENLTDLLNERARAGWTFEHAATLADKRLMLVFVRHT